MTRIMDRADAEREAQRQGGLDRSRRVQEPETEPTTDDCRGDSRLDEADDP